MLDTPARARAALNDQQFGETADRYVQSAVHAGMSGRTDMVVGFWNHQFTHVPIPLAVSSRKKIDAQGALWESVLASTGQPRDMR